jgi:ketosteroid isomerase-like protein
MTNTQTVQSVYAAFIQNDVPTIINHLADDVIWDNSQVASAECPWNGNFSGKTKVPGFFKAVGDNLDFGAGLFEPRRFVEAGNTVAVLLRLESRMTKNSQILKSDTVHFWTFDDSGLITQYQHFNDTAAELNAWNS